MKYLLKVLSLENLTKNVYITGHGKYLVKFKNKSFN